MSNQPRESKKTTKEKAAAARAAAEAEQRRRDRRVRIIGGVAIAVVMGLIIGIGIWGSRKDSSSTATDPGGIVADAALPTGVFGADNANAWGVPANTAAGKPTLAIWEDFQCPACASLEAQAGAAIEKLATDGKVNLVWRPTTFLDANFPTSPNPNSSRRATAAWGCAVDAGKAAEYHKIVFANQPPVEGDGWSTEQLIGFGEQAGITGAAFETFTSCVNASTYDQWSNNSYQTFLDSAVPGTPAAFLNGQEVPTQTLLDAAALEKLISEAAGS
jgi:protein-disulfide isomerase